MPCLSQPRFNSWIHSSFYELTIETVFWLAYRSINSTSISILNVAVRLISVYSRYDHITPLLTDRLYWLRVTQHIDFKQCLMVFKALSLQATFRTIVLEPQQLAAIESTICKSQLSGCAASVKNHQVWRTFVRNLQPHYVKLSARLCERCWLHRCVQVEPKNLLIWIIIWLDWILQLCCKCAFVLRTVRAYGLRRNINYHNNNNNTNIKHYGIHILNSLTSY